MIKFIVAFVLLCGGVVAEAQHNAKSRKWDRVDDAHDPQYVVECTAAIRELMEQNFQACTAEDLKALMKTMTSDCPDRENFMRECKQMFDDTDVYIRLVDCKWLSSWRDSRGLWAVVDIKQWTVPKDENVDYTEYRHRSGLLPEYELCEYQLHCRVENGQWKAHRINSNLFPAEWPAEGAPEQHPAAVDAKPAVAAKSKRKSPAQKPQVIAADSCPDGTCPNEWPAKPSGRPRMTAFEKK